ncbi:MAG: MBL fold metallo-hydrolase [Kiritimatiellia bacterium]
MDGLTRGRFVFGALAAAMGAATRGWAVRVAPAERFGDVTITPFSYGDFNLNQRWTLPGGSAAVPVPIVLGFHLLEFAGRRVLADVGCDAFAMGDQRARNFMKPVDLLRRQGIEPDSISACLISHHHGDHLGAIRSFPRATVYVQEKEVALAGRLLDGRDLVTFKDALTVFDGRMRLVRVGGHTPGSSIVEIPDAKTGKTAVIAGDACYVRENLEKGIPTASSQNAAESLAFVKKYADARYRVFLCHQFA